MRLEIRGRLLLAACALWCSAPAIAMAQGAADRVSLQGAVGSDLRDAGDGESVAVGFLPQPRLELLVGVERLHWPTTTDGFGATRGGTTTFASGEVRFHVRPSGRSSPYLLAGVGRGISRPNVNEIFPDRVTNSTWLMFGGGGIRLPISRRLGAFGDVRFGLQGERDTLRLLTPVRAGLSWRF
jgi:hypothetical protein